MNKKTIIIAMCLLLIVPLCTVPSEGGYQTVASLAYRATQDLSVRVDELTKRLDALEKTIKVLEKSRIKPLKEHQYDLDFKFSTDRVGKEKTQVDVYVFGDGCKAEWSLFYLGWNYDYSDKHVVNGEIVE